MLAGIAAALGSIGYASANNFGGPGSQPVDAGRHCDTTTHSQCRADNNLHSVYFENTSSIHRTAMSAAIAHYNGITPLDVYEVPPPGLSHDVGILDVSVPGNGILAWGQCAVGASYGGMESNHTRWCRPQKIKWNLPYEEDFYPSDQNRKWLACHELGHTLGLRHWIQGETSTTCMRTPTLNPKFIPPYTTTTTHDRLELIEHYE